MHVQRLITREEQDLLEKKEAVIKRGKKAFVEVGTALAEIRDAKLYRQEFKTFEEYCATKWDFSRKNAYMLIEAAEVLADLPEEMSTIVDNCGQARALKAASPENRAAVLQAASDQAASEGRPMTAQDIKDQLDAANPPDDEESPRGAPPTEDQDQEAFFGDEPDTDEPEPPVDPQLETSPALEPFLNNLHIIAEEFYNESTIADRRIACNTFDQLKRKWMGRHAA